MLNINTLNSFKTHYKSNNIQRQRTQNPFAVSNSKLAPLAFDTVSFSSGRSLNKSLFEAFDNDTVCQEVHNDAKLAEKDLKCLLDRALGEFTYTRQTPDLPIESISTRIKSPYSIREKVASELEYEITSNVPKAFNPKVAKDIKKVLGDIVGARITLRSNDSNETSKIITALIKEVEAGNLKIKGIQNYEPENLDEKYRYFKHEELRRLKDAADKARPAGANPVEYKNETKKSGYMALHIDVDLSNEDKYVAKNNGYSGEIQIIGSDVLKLKEVEDACYKLQQDKTIRAGHQAYNPFSTYFLKYYNDKEHYPTVQEDFTKYTSMAFEKQRQKEPEDTLARKRRTHVPFYKDGEVYNTCNEFLTIKEAGLTGRVPEELDFNRLADIKYFSDGLFKLTES